MYIFHFKLIIDSVERELDYARRGEEEVSNLSDLASWIAETVGYESRQIEMCVVREKMREKNFVPQIFRTIPSATRMYSRLRMEKSRMADRRRRDARSRSHCSSAHA